MRREAHRKLQAPRPLLYICCWSLALVGGEEHGIRLLLQRDKDAAFGRKGREDDIAGISERETMVRMVIKVLMSRVTEATCCRRLRGCEGILWGKGLSEVRG